MRMFYRIFFYVLGIFCIALGSNVAVNSQLGTSPVNSLPFSIAEVSGADRGICVTAVFLVYILLQALILRRDFKPKNLLQIVFSTLFGYFVSFTGQFVAGFSIPTYFGKLAMIGISILLIALGLVFYLTADIVPLPMEGLALAVSSKLTSFQFHNVKVMLDCASVALAVTVLLVGGAITRQPIQWTVREGTALSAVLVGKVMGVLAKPLKGRIAALCFGPAAEG